MPLRRLFRYFANDEIVEQLANTPIVRRGAQLTHYVYQQGMKKLNDVTSAEHVSKNQRTVSAQSPLSSFAKTFARNLQKEIDKEMKK